MNALVSYSDDEVEDRKPPKRVKNEPQEDAATLFSSRPKGSNISVKAEPADYLLPKRELTSPNIAGRNESLVVRQHRPLRKQAEDITPSPARTHVDVQIGTSKQRTSLMVHSGPSEERSPLGSRKGKERVRDEEGVTMNTSEQEAAYRRLVRSGPDHAEDSEWGLPKPPREGADPKLEAKLANFHTLKTEGTHFNTSLMRSHAFHNPHIYAKLVSFVDIEETGSNYSSMTRPGAWNPHDPELLRTGDAHTIAEEQKRMAEAKQTAQAPGKRSHIAFTTSFAKSSASKESHLSRSTSGREHTQDKDSRRASHRDRDRTRAKDDDRHRKRLLPNR